jgi:prepilin-type N-terminal cleavage/methylation domain-containing protein
MIRRGFALIELMIVMALALVIAAAVFGLLNPSQGIFATELEAADLQQRLRVAATALHRDLVLAGAGASRGPDRGSLTRFFAAIRPFRYGTEDDDQPGLFRNDTVTLVHVPETMAQTTIASLLDGSGDVRVDVQAGCPLGDAACGFRRGMGVGIYDVYGQLDLLTVDDVQDNLLHLVTDTSQPSGATYAAHSASIVQMSHVVYSLKRDTATGISQLVMRDGPGAEVPVVDHVVALTFSYYGDPRPPALAATPWVGPRPWTTYGPAPPAAGDQIPSMGYPPGENCAFGFDASSGVHQPRLATLSEGETGGLVPLPAGMLTDGPWCPDAASPHRWDADLLRIRAVAVAIRVEAAGAALRGPAGSLFTRGGTSHSGTRWLPDQAITLRVAPRNLER